MLDASHYLVEQDSFHFSQNLPATRQDIYLDRGSTDDRVGVDEHERIRNPLNSGHVSTNEGIRYSIAEPD
jgi:hypothetical protein